MKVRTYNGNIGSYLPDNGVMVFGSNTQGRHGKGAALTAKLYHGAVYGQAQGRQGMSYAIVTKDLTKKDHPSVGKGTILDQIIEFYDYADNHPHLDFYVAYSGKKQNLNGYTPEEMARLFGWKLVRRIPKNVIFEESFAELIKKLD